jgi:hypothetical protein
MMVFLVDMNKGIFLDKAILKEEWANPVMDYRGIAFSSACK